MLFKETESKDKTKFDNFYLSLEAEVVINQSTLIMCFNRLFYISNIRKSVEKGSDWIIDSVIDHTNSISKYNPLVEVVI